MRKAKRFVQLVSPYRGALSAYCGRLLWSPGDLEDALQDVLTVAFRDLYKHRPDDDPRPWLFRIATLTCFQLNRQHGRAAATDLSDELAGEAVDVVEREWTYEALLEDPHAVFENLDEEIARALRRLNENERAILLLKTLGRLTCAEIAATLEVPLGTAQGLLTRARMKMREYLSDFARSKGLRCAGRVE